MDGKCEGCGADMTIQRTHWDGCHTTHKQCAAFKAGREAGLREAAKIAEKEEEAFMADSGSKDLNDHYAACASGAGSAAAAILSAIGGGK